MDRALGKIGSRKWMSALVDRGSIRMRRLASYRTIAGAEMGDPDEGLALKIPEGNAAGKLTVLVGKKRMELSSASVRVFHGPNETDIGAHAVYCMHGFVRHDGRTFQELDVARIAQDNRLREFGDTLVVVANAKEFSQRLQLAASRAGYELAFSPIEYVPSDYRGEMGWCRKLERFRHQSEVRFITRKPISEAFLELSLGSLEDIAVLFDLSAIHAK